MAMRIIPAAVLCCLFFATQVTAQEAEQPTPGLNYLPASSKLLYDVELKADFGEPKYNVAYNGVLAYTIARTDDGDLDVRCTGQLKSVSPTGYRSAPAGFQFGPIVQSSRFTTFAHCVIAPNGKPRQVNRAQWIFGLPLDFGRLAFPELSEDEEWTIEQSVAFVRGLLYRDYYQLLPVSSYIKPDPNRAALQRARRKPPESPKVTIGTTVRKRSDKDDATIIAETYSLVGADFDPAVTLSGTGEIVYSKKLQHVQSLKRDIRIKLKQPNKEITVPVSIRVAILSGEKLAKYEEEQEKLRVAAEERRQKMAALEQQVPTVADREAMIATLRGENQEHFETMVRRINSSDLKEDPELARILYGQIFRSGSSSYLVKNLIKRFDPDLEKTAALADKYDGSFDIELTGDAVEANTKLQKGQLVCMPYYSSWKAGLFYGAVDDVLVLTTIERTPKLVAIRRKECRMPSPAFIDPALDESSRE